MASVDRSIVCGVRGGGWVMSGDSRHPGCAMRAGYSIFVLAATMLVCGGCQNTNVAGSPLPPAAILGCFALACSTMDIEIVRFEASAALPPSDPCGIRFHRGSTVLERECDLIARIRIRDTGFSNDCRSDRIRREIQRIGCEMGGDSAELRAVSNSLSTCIESDADLYRCDPGRVSGSGSRGAPAASGSGGSPNSDAVSDSLPAGTRVD